MPTKLEEVHFNGNGFGTDWRDIYLPRNSNIVTRTTHNGQIDRKICILNTLKKQDSIGGSASFIKDGQRPRDQGRNSGITYKSTIERKASRLQCGRLIEKDGVFGVHPVGKGA